MLNRILNFFRNSDPPEEISIYPVTREVKPLPVETSDISDDPGLFFHRRKEAGKKKEINDLQTYISDYKEYCLEKTSNQHILKTPGYKVLEKDGSTETFKISGDGFIFHNEHHLLRVESEYFVKYIQQEYNPITKLIENAYD